MGYGLDGKSGGNNDCNVSGKDYRQSNGKSCRKNVWEEETDAQFQIRLI